MIVEGLILAGIVGSLFIKPTKSVLVANTVAKAKLEVPRTKKIGDEVVTIEDFVTEKGATHTQYAGATVRTSDGKKRHVVLTKAEVELMQHAALLRDARMKGLPVEVHIPRLGLLVQARTDEIARAKSRRIKSKSRKPKARRRKAS
jgi:hypothetical protein